MERPEAPDRGPRTAGGPPDAAAKTAPGPHRRPSGPRHGDKRAHPGLTETCLGTTFRASGPCNHERNPVIRRRVLLSAGKEGGRRNTRYRGGFEASSWMERPDAQCRDPRTAGGPPDAAAKTPPDPHRRPSGPRYGDKRAHPGLTETCLETALNPLDCMGFAVPGSGGPLRAHRAARRRSVAAGSSSPDPSISTRYTARARSRDTSPSRTSRCTACGSRDHGGP